MRRMLIFSVIFFFSSFGSALTGTVPGPALATSYSYEFNVAPLAVFVNWLSFDFVALAPPEAPYLAQRIGYGVSLIRYAERATDEHSSLYPNNEGFAYGLNLSAEILRGDYLATHLFYEKYNRYQKDSALVQHREGLRWNVVYGQQAIYSGIKCRFGFGVEAAAHQVREGMVEAEDQATHYTTTAISPFLEFKAGLVF